MTNSQIFVSHLLGTLNESFSNFVQLFSHVIMVCAQVLIQNSLSRSDTFDASTHSLDINFVLTLLITLFTYTQAKCILQEVLLVQVHPIVNNRPTAFTLS